MFQGKAFSGNQSQIRANQWQSVAISANSATRWQSMASVALMAISGNQWSSASTYLDVPAEGELRLLAPPSLGKPRGPHHDEHGVRRR